MFSGMSHIKKNPFHENLGYKKLNLKKKNDSQEECSIRRNDF